MVMGKVELGGLKIVGYISMKNVPKRFAHCGI